MNKVDRFIKKHLLEYPTLYRNRFDFLTNMIIHANDWLWKDGEIVDETAFPDRSDTEIDGKAEVKKRLAEAKQKDYAWDTLNTEQEYNDLLWREKNIDAIASEIHAVDRDYRYTKFQALVFSISSLGRQHLSNVIIKFSNEEYTDFPYMRGDGMPVVEDMDPDWKVAIREWVMEMLPQLHGQFGAWNDETTDFDIPEDTDKNIAALYKRCKELVTELQTKEDRELNKKRNEIAKRIVDKIITEEKDE